MSLAATSRTFAPYCVVFQPLDDNAIVACGPTRANVAYTSAIPPVVGTTKNPIAGLARGNSSAIGHSLFCLSDFCNMNNNNTLRQSTTWKEAAAEMVQRIGIDLRNHTMSPGNPRQNDAAVDALSDQN